MLTAKIESSFAPEANDDGQQDYGIDVRLSNGDPLELTFTNAGWEKSFVGNLETGVSGKARRR